MQLHCGREGDEICLMLCYNIHALQTSSQLMDPAKSTTRSVESGQVYEPGHYYLLSTCSQGNAHRIRASSVAELRIVEYVRVSKIKGSPFLLDRMYCNHFPARLSTRLARISDSRSKSTAYTTLQGVTPRLGRKVLTFQRNILTPSSV